MGLKNLLVQLLIAAPLGLAHPHSGEKEKLHYAMPMPRSLSHCKANFEHPEFVKRTVERRLVEIENLKRERGIEHHPTLVRRQGGGQNNAARVLAINHRVNISISENTNIAALLADSGNCVLSPEVTEGPLYVRGEQVRKNITDNEKGVRMRIHVQVVDTKTCNPVPQVFVDFWSCNTTGVYGGVTGYPGNGVDPNDPRLLNTTVLRGIQPTDKDGIAIFESLVPGHYAGRATHVHAMVHHGATQLANGTITGGRVSHIGQIYFDMSLLQAVERTQPYASNKQTWMQNSADMLFSQGAGNGHDPIVRYAQLSEDINQGIFAWIRFGVDTAATRRYNPAAYLDEKGGHKTGGAGGGFGGGGFGGGGFGGGMRPPGQP